MCRTKNTQHMASCNCVLFSGSLYKYLLMIVINSSKQLRTFTLSNAGHEHSTRPIFMTSVICKTSGHVDISYAFSLVLPYYVIHWTRKDSQFSYAREVSLSLTNDSSPRSNRFYPNVTLQMVMMETVISGISDIWPHVLRKKKTLFTFCVCVIGFCLGIPMTTKVRAVYIHSIHSL